MQPRILAFAGSAREQSWNKKLIRLGADAARAAGAEVTLIDLRDFPMPLMDEDLEAREGLPENARKLKDLMIGHQGLFISSPEYNSSLPPLLKNVIDWTSRPSAKDEKAYLATAGKWVALMAASPGNFGGIRMLPLLRLLMSNMQCHVLPQQLALPKADKAFGTDGKLTDAGQAKQLDGLARALVARLS